MSHKLVPGAQYSWNSPKQHGGHSFVLFQIRHFSSTLITILSQEHHFKNCRRYCVDLSFNFRSKMASSRIGNASPSEFRLVLTKLTEVQKKLDTTDQSSVMAQLRQVNDSLQIVEGNQTDISDAILNKLQSIETRIETGFKALEEKIAALERKVVDGPAIAEGSAFGMLTPPSSSKKRKIARHPDLSVSNLSRQHIRYS